MVIVLNVFLLISSLVSVLMRDQANMSGDGPKWIVFDGDIDPMWIESLNTVMDDNKVLTLASNERIALTKQMRLIFEISNLKYVLRMMERYTKHAQDLCECITFAHRIHS